MAAHYSRFACVTLTAVVLICGGCGQPSPKVDVKVESTDLRKLSVEEVAAKIKAHLKGEYATVELSADGLNKFKGKATTAERKVHELTATVTAAAIEYNVTTDSGFHSGKIGDSKTTIDAKVGN